MAVDKFSHPSRPSDDLHVDAEHVPLTDLEAGGPATDRSANVETTQESGRSDDSLDLPEDDIDHGLLSGRRNRDPYTADHKQSASGRLASIGAFLRGPEPLHKHRIKPFFESFQTAPVRAFNRLFPNVRLQIVALVAFHALWAVVFLTILNWSVVGPEIPGYGMPNRLSCGSTLW